MEDNMRKAILDFPKQFSYKPEIQNAEKFKASNSYVIGGMGGSGLVAGILRRIKPTIDVAAHHEYGIPKYIKNAAERMFVAVSHSGNTEETLDFFESAAKEGLNMAAVSSGGKLKEISDERGVPYISLPDTGIQPRMAIGYMLLALLKLFGEEGVISEAEKLSSSLKSEEYEEEGRNISEAIGKKIPIIYASRQNHTLAYNWKIKFNETGKIPAFYNTFPELNHNEMAGFTSGKNADAFHVILIRDGDDDDRIKNRMDVLEKMYAERGISSSSVAMEGGSTMEKIFRCMLIADWAAYHTATKNGSDPDESPMIEEFKKLVI